MTHAEMDELYDAYALGALDPELASEINAHLEDGCDYCREHVQTSQNVGTYLSGMAEQVSPPARLRKRVLAAVESAKPARSWFWAIAGLTAACVALFIFGAWAHHGMRQANAQLAVLQQERNQLREALAIMSESQTRAVQFGTDNVPHGRVFLSRQAGLVFVGSRLPQIASDKTFELWLIPKIGAPQPAGLFKPNAAGTSVNIDTQAIDMSQTTAVAVTVEPLNGSSAPTTKPFLVVPLA